MAIAQLGVLLAAGRVARRVDRLLERLDRDLGPALEHLNAIGRDASRAMALATAQVERVDRLFGDLATRVEETFDTVQASIIGPAREGKALLVALRAALDAIRDARRARARQRAEDEDALFI
jgi:hypothetical protein